MKELLNMTQFTQDEMNRIDTLYLEMLKWIKDFDTYPTGKTRNFCFLKHEVELLLKLMGVHDFE